ncbi:MAG: hypothetical protein VB050_15610 [Geobacteraceae bacterium]|nr:hypothetical protein [Geobacteraceae bacterium]
MAFFSRYLALAACFATISGCFQVETTVRVNPDGSGTIEERMLLSRKVISQFDEMARSFAGPDEKPKPFTLHEEEKLRKQAADFGPGVVYVKSRVIEDEAYTGYRATYSFADINKVRLSSRGSESMAGKEEKQAGSDADAVAFRFDTGPESRLVIFMPRNGKAAQASDPKGNDSEEPAMTPEQKQAFADMMKGMHFSLAVEVKGTVVKSNATHLAGNRITLFDFDLDRMGGSFEDLSKLRAGGGSQPPTFAEARDLLKDLPGVAIELHDRVEVRFRK